VESRQLCLDSAMHLKAICEKLQIPFVFKSSYRKANRTRVDAFSGLGDELALEILQQVREKLDIPVLTDVHTAEEAQLAAKYVDVLQIPAFLCRQTDLLLSAGETGRVVNIKKGQFANAATMQYAVEKVKSTGNQQVWLTERGNSFGYEDLVVDIRNIPLMQQSGVPVLLDVTHAMQRPNQAEGGSSGTPQYISTLAKAGIAAGADGLFIETHPDPSKALSDGSNMLPLVEMEALLAQLVRIAAAVK
jgi:2-dehydro-3-deoxyphosphooctonate aldolase (KDO 8-P synthase)